MAIEAGLLSISHAIQQAVAPVFLLAGIGAILNVLTSRLARIIDRSRQLHGRIETVSESKAKDIRQELNTLTKRGRVVHRSIAFATTSALLICVVIATLFISAVADWDSSIPVVALFVLAMCSLILALTGLLREIQLATRVIFNGP